MLEGGFCLSPKSFSRIPLVRTQAEKEETPLPPRQQPFIIKVNSISIQYIRCVGLGWWVLSLSQEIFKTFQTQAEKEETPPAPQAPSIRISCSPTSSIHHSQTGRGRRKETSIASDVNFFFNFLQFLQKLSKDDTSCGKMSFLWLKTKMTGPDFLSTFFSQLFSRPFLVTKWKRYLSFADKLQTKHGEKMLTPS